MENGLKKEPIFLCYPYWRPLENGEDIEEETLQPKKAQEVIEEKEPIPLEEIGIAFYKQNIQADILKKTPRLVYTTNQLPEEKDHSLKTLLLREAPEGQPYYLVPDRTWKL